MGSSLSGNGPGPKLSGRDRIEPRGIDGRDVHRTAEGCGILVYLQEGAAGVPAGQLAGAEKTGSAAQRQKSWRDVGLGAQILRDLNVSSIRLVSSSNRHYVGLSGFGIEIAETIKLD